MASIASGWAIGSWRQLEDEDVQGITFKQAVEKMRRPVGTKIKAMVMRKAATNRSRCEPDMPRCHLDKMVCAIALVP
jgi:hypothetical protein